MRVVISKVFVTAKVDGVARPPFRGRHLSVKSFEKSKIFKLDEFFIRRVRF